MFSNFFRKSCRLWDMSKNQWSQGGRTWQYGGTVLAGLVRLHVRQQTPTPASVYPRTPTHPHTQKYVIVIALPQQRWFCWLACATLYARRLSCSISQSVQTGSATRPASYSVDTGVCFPGSKAASPLSWPLIPVQCEAKMSRAIPPLSLSLYGVLMVNFTLCWTR